jgi:hypothetical protein
VEAVWPGKSHVAEEHPFEMWQGNWAKVAEAVFAIERVNKRGLTCAVLHTGEAARQHYQWLMDPEEEEEKQPSNKKPREE